MITRKEYLEALDIIQEYHKKFNLPNKWCGQLAPDLSRNDFIEYVGGSSSKYLTKGNKYRLTCKPYKDRVCIINDAGKRMNTNVRYFK